MYICRETCGKDLSSPFFTLFFFCLFFFGDTLFYLTFLFCWKRYRPDVLVAKDMFPDLKVGDLIDLYQPDSECSVHVLLQVRCSGALLLISRSYQGDCSVSTI